MINPALLSYIAVMSITPGPNNMMLASSGVQFGMRRTLPHMLGISIGLAFLMFLTMAMLAWVLTLFNVLRLPLALAGCGYLLWLSWSMARAASPTRLQESQPMSFGAAAWFQWLNPKVWVMVLNAAVVFFPANNAQRLDSLLLLAVLCGLINFPCIGVWALAGDRLRHWLSTPRWLLLFNLCMALFMAATAIWMGWDQLGA